MTTVDKALAAREARLDRALDLHDRAMHNRDYERAQAIFGIAMTLMSDIRALSLIQELQHGDLEIMEQDNAGADHARTD
jgi:hypothetical protein